MASTKTRANNVIRKQLMDMGKIKSSPVFGHDALRMRGDRVISQLNAVLSRRAEFKQGK